jgi:hypothetical protein
MFMKKQAGKTRKKRTPKSKSESVSEWRPRAQLIAMAELLVNPEDRRPKSEKIIESGLTERAFYRWMKDERYLNYINSLLDKYTNSELPGIWRALIRKCIMGDMAAIKLYFELKGLVPDYKQRKLMDQHKMQYDQEMLELKKKELEAKEW